MRSPWVILSLDPSVSYNEGRKRYLELCKKYHPDKGGDPEKFKEVNEAWNSIKEELGNGVISFTHTSFLKVSVLNK